jgi:hypothetical protein
MKLMVLIPPTGDTFLLTPVTFGNTTHDPGCPDNYQTAVTWHNPDADKLVSITWQVDVDSDGDGSYDWAEGTVGPETFTATAGDGFWLSPTVLHGTFGYGSGSNLFQATYTISVDGGTPYVVTYLDFGAHCD